MIKRLLAKMKINKQKKLINTSSFSVDSLSYIKITYYQAWTIENHGGYDAICKIVEYYAILTNYPYVHFKSGKTAKELVNSKKSDTYLVDIRPLIELDKIQFYLNRHRLKIYDKLSREDIIAMEQEINLTSDKKNNKSYTNNKNNMFY
jgi:hypothetical protein